MREPTYSILGTFPSLQSLYFAMLEMYVSFLRNMARINSRWFHLENFHHLHSFISYDDSRVLL